MIGSFWNFCRACPSMPVEKLHSEYRSTFQWHEYVGSHNDYVTQPPVVRQPSQTHQESLSALTGRPEEPSFRRKKHPDLANRCTKEWLSKSSGPVYEASLNPEIHATNISVGGGGGAGKSCGPRKSISMGTIRSSGITIVPIHTEQIHITDRITISADETTVGVGGMTSSAPGGQESYMNPGMMTDLSGNFNDFTMSRPSDVKINMGRDMQLEGTSHDARAFEDSRSRKEYKSEYKKRFRPFSTYEYVDGKFFKKPGNHPPEENPWYKEVIELRKKAGEYKFRGWGAELGPENIAQVYHQHVWDQVSRRTSLAALALITTTTPKSITRDENTKENIKKSYSGKFAHARPHTATPKHPISDLEKSKFKDIDAVQPSKKKLLEETRIQNKTSRIKEIKTNSSASRLSPSSKSSTSPISANSPTKSRIEHKKLKLLREARSQSAGPPGRSPRKTIRQQSAASSVSEKDNSSSTGGWKSNLDSAQGETCSPKPTAQRHPRPTTLATSPRPKASSGKGDRDSNTKLEKQQQFDKNSADPYLGYNEPVVKSPPEPTRVKSPEQVILRSPDPVNWTVPLDTTKSFTVTQNIREAPPSPRFRAGEKLHGDSRNAHHLPSSTQHSSAASTIASSPISTFSTRSAPLSTVSGSYNNNNSINNNSINSATATTTTMTSSEAAPSTDNATKSTKSSNLNGKAPGKLQSSGSVEDSKRASTGRVAGNGTSQSSGGSGRALGKSSSISGAGGGTGDGKGSTFSSASATSASTGASKPTQSVTKETCLPPKIINGHDDKAATKLASQVKDKPAVSSAPSKPTPRMGASAIKSKEQVKSPPATGQHTSPSPSKPSTGTPSPASRTSTAATTPAPPKSTSGPGGASSKTGTSGHPKTGQTLPGSTTGTKTGSSSSGFAGRTGGTGSGSSTSGTKGGSTVGKSGTTPPKTSTTPGSAAPGVSIPKPAATISPTKAATSSPAPHISPKSFGSYGSPKSTLAHSATGAGQSGRGSGGSVGGGRQGSATVTVPSTNVPQSSGIPVLGSEKGTNKSKGAATTGSAAGLKCLEDPTFMFDPPAAKTLNQQPSIMTTSMIAPSNFGTTRQSEGGPKSGIPTPASSMTASMIAPKLPEPSGGGKGGNTTMMSTSIPSKKLDPVPPPPPSRQNPPPKVPDPPTAARPISTISGTVPDAMIKSVGPSGALSGVPSTKIPTGIPVGSYKGYVDPSLTNSSMTASIMSASTTNPFATNSSPNSSASTQPRVFGSGAQSTVSGIPTYTPSTLGISLPLNSAGTTSSNPMTASTMVSSTSSSNIPKSTFRVLEAPSPSSPSAVSQSTNLKQKDVLSFIPPAPVSVTKKGIGGGVSHVSEIPPPPHKGSAGYRVLEAPEDPDADEPTVSVISPGTGRSRASDVLEKARHRFDKFWGKDKDKSRDDEK